MKYLINFLFLLSFFTLNANDNFCRKCQILNEYHKKNPSQYIYYEDYLKDVNEKGEEAVNPRYEDLPEDVQRIVDPERKAPKK